MFLLKILFGDEISNADENTLKKMLRRHIIDGELKRVKDILRRRNYMLNLPLDEHGRTPLHYAAYYRRLDMVDWLISEGAFVNQLTVNKKAPLHVVFPHVFLTYKETEVNRFETEADGKESPHLKSIVTSLLKNGADPNLQDTEGLTPLHFAVLHQSFNLVTLLIKNGANISTLDTDHKSPLYMARGDAIDWVLDSYGDLDAQDIDGQTLLHKVMRTTFNPYRPEIVQEIVDRGATIDILDSFLNTPIQYWLMSTNEYWTSKKYHLPRDPLCTQYHFMNEGIFFKQMIKLHNAGIPLRDIRYFTQKINCFYEYKLQPWFKRIRSDYLEELDKLSAIPVHQGLTLFHVIRCKPSTNNFLADESTVEMVEKIIYSLDLRTRFPNYGNIFKKVFEYSKKRSGLMDKAFESLLSQDCPQGLQVLMKDQYAVDYLFQYLSNDDLQNLAAVCN